MAQNEKRHKNSANFESFRKKKESKTTSKFCAEFGKRKPKRIRDTTGTQHEPTTTNKQNGVAMLGCENLSDKIVPWFM